MQELTAMGVLVLVGVTEQDVRLRGLCIGSNGRRSSILIELLISSQARQENPTAGTTS